VDGLVSDLDHIYGDTTLTFDQKVRQRDTVFARSLEHFDRDVRPTFENLTFGGFRDTPLNNATLLARIRYFHRLPDFQALLEAHDGSLRAVLQDLRERVRTARDPFDALPSAEKARP
jgi:hypothetical protein